MTNPSFSHHGDIGDISVALVDQHTLVRQCLRLALEQEPGIEVVAEAASMAEAKDIDDDLDIDVIVTELDLPDARGPEVPATLADNRPGVSILVITGVDQPARVEEAIAAGAHGYVLKTAAVADVVRGIRTVARGDTYLQPSLGIEIARWHMAPHGNGGPFGRLSPKEEEVLRLVALGHTNAEIGRLLSISLRTVETHRSRLLQKLGSQSRAELVQFAHEAGLLYTRN